MNIQVSYYRNNFFGEKVYCEDATNDGTGADALKALRALKSGKVEGVRIDSLSIFYDSIDEKNAGVVTVCSFGINSTDIRKISYEKLKDYYKRA